MDDKNKHAVEIYNLIAEDYSKNYDSIDGEEDLIFLKTFLNYLTKGDLIADIGCGTGFSANWFSNQGMSVEGSDLSFKMIEIAKRNFPAIDFSVSDMRTFVPKKVVDSVWAGYSMFHLNQHDFEVTLKNIKNYLKPNGIFGLVMQEGDGEVEIPEPFLPNSKIYIHLYRTEELQDILSKYGFDVVETKIKPPLHPNEFNFNKLLVIARNKD
jgi:SAM-dependent methyltransferase